MNTYNSIDEKEPFFQFGGIEIDNEEDFIKYTDLLFAQNSRDEFIFRGVSESKFKIFNTVQRLWSESKSKDLEDEEQYDKFIISLMDACKSWNSGTITNLFKTYGINENNSIAYLSFMQHYGLPTPFIDFTSDVNNAFYFAVESIPDKIVENKNEINNYFSIYSTYENNTFYEGFKDIFDSNRTNKNYGIFDYGDLTKNGVLLISRNIQEFMINNNIRIANQKGLFFYNNSPNLSIEEQYKLLADLYTDKFGNEIFEKLLAHKTFSCCFNFHKKYAKRVKQILEEMHINKDFIYPDIDKLKYEILKSAHNNV